jgi:parallel beta-helix repeat protein
MAIITVTPLMDITALIASEQVSPGDVLLLEEGIYFQTVNVTKDFLRIIAKGEHVIFDGRSTLLNAFMLSNVTGVEINGITINHYRSNGIVINSGNGNRIVNNKISDIFVDGIRIVASSANLIWKNEICNVFDAVFLILGSTNNRIIENIAKDCLEDGFETFLEPDSNNVFISNTIMRARRYGILIWGHNNLLLYNNIIDNGQGSVNINVGSNSIALDNILIDNKQNGLVVEDFLNAFAGENQIECNREEGVLVQGQYGIYQDNEIAYNSDTGITIGTNSISNTIYKNKVICNIPTNIIDSGTDNVLIENIDKPCESCENPGHNCEPLTSFLLDESL